MVDGGAASRKRTLRLWLVFGFVAAAMFFALLGILVVNDSIASSNRQSIIGSIAEILEERHVSIWSRVDSKQDSATAILRSEIGEAWPSAFANMDAEGIHIENVSVNAKIRLRISQGRRIIVIALDRNGTTDTSQ